MKLIRKVFKFLVFVTWVAGWALAASAVHVVRTPDKVVVIPKDRLGFGETYADIRTWTLDDAANHPQITARLTATGKGDLLANLSAATVQKEADEATKAHGSSAAPIAPTSTPEPNSKSIFD